MAPSSATACTVGGLIVEDNLGEAALDSGTERGKTD
jgi:hypothetical protein